MIPPTLTVQIECAIARGDDPIAFCEHAGIDTATFDAVLRRMDAIAAEPAALKPHGTHAAYVRHRNANEKPCHRCARGERMYQAAQHVERKSRAAA